MRLKVAVMPGGHVVVALSGEFDIATAPPRSRLSRNRLQGPRDMGPAFLGYDRAEAFMAADAPLLVVDTGLVIRDVNPAYLRATDREVLAHQQARARTLRRPQRSRPRRRRARTAGMTARLFASTVARAGQIHFGPSGEIAGLRFLPPQ